MQLYGWSRNRFSQGPFVDTDCRHKKSWELVPSLYPSLTSDTTTSRSWTILFVQNVVTRLSIQKRAACGLLTTSCTFTGRVYTTQDMALIPTIIRQRVIANLMTNKTVQDISNTISSFEQAVPVLLATGVYALYIFACTLSPFTFALDPSTTSLFTLYIVF